MRALPFLVLLGCGEPYDEAYVAEAINLTMKAMGDAGVKMSHSIRHVMFEPTAPSGLDTGYASGKGTCAFIQMGVVNDPVLFHEIGHVLGLKHSDDPKSIMNHHVPRLETKDAIDQLVEGCSKTLCWRLEM